MSSATRTGAIAIVGRRAERAWLRAHSQPDARIAITGPPGIGKSTIWNEAVEGARARGSSILVAVPTAAETSLSYSVVADLIAPLADAGLGSLPDVQRRAIDAVLVRSEIATTDLRSIAAAVRSLFETCLKDSVWGAIVAIDDAQWVDPSSAAVLSYSLRRIAAMGTIVSWRQGHTVPLDLFSDSDTIAIGPLSQSEMFAVVRERLGVTLRPAALARVHELSGGIAFYAIELVSAERAGGLDGQPVQSLPVARIRAMPVHVRLALGTLAITGSVSGARSMAPAQLAGIVETVGGRAQFAHPLLAEAAVLALDETQRRRIHADAAKSALDDEQRARHLALAGIGPDEAISAQLSGLASRAETQGRLIAAAELFELAAVTSPPGDRERIAELRVRAGICRILAGDPDLGMDLIRRHVEDLPVGPTRHRGLVYLAFELAATDSSAPISIIEQVIAESIDTRQRFEARRLLSSFRDVVGDFDGANAALQKNLDEAIQIGDDELLSDALLSRASRRLFEDRPVWDLLEQWQIARDRAAADDDPVDLPAWMPVHTPVFAHLRDGDIGTARRLLVEETASSNIYHAAGHAAMLAMVAMAEGDFVSADEQAREELAIGEQEDAPYLILDGLILVSLCATLAGRPDDAREFAVRALEKSVEVRSDQGAWDAYQALAVCALSEGKHEEAEREFEMLPLRAWRRWAPLAGGRLIVDAIETAALLGDRERASTLTEFVPDDATDRAIADGCLMLANGDLGGAARVVSEAPAQPSPFREARRELLLGRILRRARRRNDARRSLEDARAHFMALGAYTWADRAQEEIGRLGGRAPAGDRLTESETRVAGLVAAGLSNKEIAARLGIAVRTVEAHLSKIYVKLEVGSRVELAGRVVTANIVDIRNRRTTSSGSGLAEQPTGTAGQ